MTQILFWNLKTAQEQSGAFGDLSHMGLQGIKLVDGMKAPPKKVSVKVGNSKLEQMLAAKERREQQENLRNYVDEQ